MSLPGFRAATLLRVSNIQIVRHPAYLIEIDTVQRQLLQWEFASVVLQVPALRTLVSDAHRIRGH